VCDEETNSGVGRYTDAKCVACDVKACPVDFVPIHCEGKEKKREGQTPESNPDSSNRCKACLLPQDVVCPIGQFIPRCVLGNTAPNYCRDCGILECTVEKRPNTLTSWVWGYIMKTCKDDRIGTLNQKNACEKCTQSCGTGKYREACTGKTYEPSECNDCTLYTLGITDNRCPANTYLPPP